MKYDKWFTYGGINIKFETMETFHLAPTQFILMQKDVVVAMIPKKGIKM